MCSGGDQPFFLANFIDQAKTYFKIARNVCVCVCEFFLCAQVAIIFFFSLAKFIDQAKEISKLLEMCVCVRTCVCSSGDQVVFSSAKFNDLAKRNCKLLKTCCYICTVSFLKTVRFLYCSQKTEGTFFIFCFFAKFGQNG